MNTEGEKIQWHPAFDAALQIELGEEAKYLTFEPEHLLSKKPMQIDVLVKNEKKVKIRKNIGRIVRQHNIIEYKSPEDHLNIDDFYKVYGYTCIYKTEVEKVNQIPAEELTITFVCYHYPRQMLRNLQNERNIKNRHPERNRTVEDLLKNKKTCPEETIYQIGTVEESVPPEILLQVANDFFGEMESRFGTHVHILNWALHLDEGTPHIQERHVFDCKNQYGELCPQQEKALEELGIPLPDSTKPKGRHNNRKQTFDAMCREILFEICERYGLQLDREPIYGGKAYLEKNDFIIEKQKQVMAEKEQALSEITMKLEDAKSLIEEIADTAYEKSCEVIAETVFAETQKQNLEVVANYQKWITEESNVPDDKKFAISKSLDALQNRMKKTADKLLNKVLTVLKLSTIKEKNMTVVKEKAKESLLAKLRRNKELVKKDGDSDKKIKQKNMER